MKTHFYQKVIHIKRGLTGIYHCMNGEYNTVTFYSTYNSTTIYLKINLTTIYPANDLTAVYPTIFSN